MLRIGAVTGVTQHPQTHVEDFAHIVGQIHPTFEALIPEIFPGGHRLAFNIGGIDTNTRCAPKVRHAVLVVRIDIQTGEFGIKLFKAADFASINGQQQPLVTHFTHVVGRRHRKIISGALVQQFEPGVHGFVAVVGGVDNFDAGFILEAGQHLLWHVLRPVIQVQYLRIVRTAARQAQYQQAGQCEFLHCLLLERIHCDTISITSENTSNKVPSAFTSGLSPTRTME